jgi:hypothetical protein
MSKASAVLALAAVLATAHGTSAQAPTQPASAARWQFIVNSGSVIPTGAQRDAVRRGGTTSAQLSYGRSQGLAITGSFGWTRTRDVASTAQPRLDVFSYDVGAELRAGERLRSRGFTASPFAGLGAGGRSYNYRSLSVEATHNLAGYASAGAELGVGSRLKVRLEGRDYLSGFRPLTGDGATELRNDVAVLLGLRLRVR